MSGISRYNIAFKGLALGEHIFEYAIDKDFFGIFNGGIVEDGNLVAKVTLNKQSNLLVFHFQINGIAYVPCDRCLDIYEQHITNTAKVYVKYGEDNYEEGDDVIWVEVTEHQINIAPMIYDYILLGLPIRQVHPKDKNGESLCNKEMIEKLESFKYTQQEDDKTDSRWNELKKLLETDKK